MKLVTVCVVSIASVGFLVAESHGECSSAMGDHTPKTIFYTDCKPPQSSEVTAPITCCDVQNGTARGYPEIPDVPCGEDYPPTASVTLEGSCYHRPLTETRSVKLEKRDSGCGDGDADAAGGGGSGGSSGGGALLAGRALASPATRPWVVPAGAPTWRMKLGHDVSGNYLGHLEIDPAVAFRSAHFGPRQLRLVVDEGNSPDVVWDERGCIRQLCGKECFVEIVSEGDTGAFDIRFYHPQSLEKELDERGNYVTIAGAVPFVTYRVGEVHQASDRISLSVVEVRENMVPLTVELLAERLRDGSEFFGISYGNGDRVTGIECSGDGSVKKVVRGAGYEAVVRKTYLDLGGRSLLKTSVRESGDASESVSYSYVTDPDANGYQGISSSVTSSGLETRYEYDSHSRVIRQLTYLPDEDMPVSEWRRSYEPLGVRPHSPEGDAMDVADDDGTVDVGVPRIETEYRFGVLVAKTLRFVSLDTMNHRIIEEVRLADPASANSVAYEWDNPANGRTYTDYMPYDRCKPCSELPSLVMRADGTIDVYAYSAGEYEPGANGTAGVFTDSGCGVGDFFRTVVTHYAAGMTTIPNVTTRDVKIEIRSSKKTLLREQYVCTAPNAYARVLWTATTRDALGQETLVVKSDGTRVEKTYAGRRLASMTDAEGLTTTYTYDALGRVIAETKSGGGIRPDTTISTTYDPEDRVLSRTVTSGNLSETETYEYDALGRTVATTDASGIETRYFYSTNPTLGLETRTTIRAFGTDCAETNMTISYADGRTKETRLNGIVKTAYEYGPNWTKIYEGPAGLASPRWSCSHEDALGRTVCETRPGFRGALLVTSNEYNTANQLVATRSYVLNENSTPTLLTYTYFCYNTLGERNLTVFDMNLNNQIDWNDTDRIVSNDVRFVMLEGDWWRESSTWQTRQNGSPELTLMGRNRTRLTGLGNGLVSETRSFDSLGNETITCSYRDRAIHTTTQTTQTPASSLAAETIARCGLTVSSRSTTGVTTTYSYDALGRQISQTDGRGNTSQVVYDAQGRIAKTIDPLGNETTYAHDALGRQVAVTDPLGHTITTTYDAEGRVLAQRGATYPVDYTYDAYGNKVSMTTYRNEALTDGDTTRWLYDEPSGCMTNKVYADGKGPRYDYTPDGKLARRVWARGIATDYTYDNAGKLTRTEYNDNGVTPTITMSYDRVGNLVNATTAGVVTNLYAYDLYGHCTNEWQNDFNLTRYFDNLGRNTGYAINGERQTTIAYDTFGRIASMRTAERRSGILTASNENEFVWSYLPSSDLKASLQYPNGLTASWTYDANNQLLQVRNATPTNVISQFDYTYDAAGRRTAIAKSGTAFGDLSGSVDSYTYNARSELTSARRTKNGQPIPGFSEDFDYDPIGNRRSSSTYNEKGEAQTSTYEANNLNQYTQRTTPGYAAVRGEADPNATVTVNENPTFRLGSYYFGSDLFDNSTAGGLANLETYATLSQTAANGEEADDLVSATTNQVYLAQSPDTFAYDNDGNQTLITTKTGLWRVTYNGENRPICWVRDSDNMALTMSYDHMGRRRQKNDQRFFYEGYLQVADNAENSYAWDCTENVATRPLAWNHGNSSAYFTHDGNKNVCEIVDASGDSAAHYDYAPFGAVRSVFGEVANANVWRFSSEYADDDISLVYYNYRHYDTGSGRWLSRDYVDEVFFVENISLDLYGFIDNCPINITDYIGFKPNWPPIEPRPGPKPQRPGAGLIASLAFQAALQFFDEAMVSCDKDCVTAAKCMSCCNGFTAIAMAAATAAYLEGCAECAKFVNPIAIFACIGVVGSMYNDTLDDILEAQDNCLNSCFDNPIR